MSATFRKRLLKGEPLFGTMVTLTAPAASEVIANTGFDWLFIDGEHGPFETGDVAAVLQAVGHRVACIVRVPVVAELPIKKALDLGAHGIIAPQVNTVEQAQAVVSWCRYSPQGARGVGLARAHGYGSTFSEYLKSANEEVTVIVQAEHIQAVENIEAIIQVPGIDAILIGPYDLSSSLGKLGQLDDPAVVGAIDHVTNTCVAAGMPLGIFGITADAVRKYYDRGFTLIAAGVDTMLLGQAASALLGGLR
jgi:2-keto-3-deoxy-L-rhamnonate aldolase RhmA